MEPQCFAQMCCQSLSLPSIKFFFLSFSLTLTHRLFTTAWLWFLYRESPHDTCMLWESYEGQVLHSGRQVSFNILWEWYSSVRTAGHFPHKYNVCQNKELIGRNITNNIFYYQCSLTQFSQALQNAKLKN